MVWIRAAYFGIEFNCCYVGNFVLRKKAVYENVRILERFIKRPTESLDVWADRVSRDTAEESARIACEELSVRFYGCEIEVTGLRYSEMLIPPERPPAEKLPTVAPEVELPTVPLVPVVAPPTVIPPPEVRKVPKYILDQISLLELRYEEAETIDERMAIREEIDNLKKRYEI